MGVVYLAKQSALNRDVALKMVLAGGHASIAERIRFLAEAEAVAAVQHPGIVQVFDFGTHAGQPFFALEYLPGGSLADSLQKALPEPKAAAALIEKLARAVHAAHEKGIIHRDLKPSNILLAADGSPKVTDFGLARKADSGSGLTQTGAILGTPSYMSPEQASGNHDRTGPTTDVYALGAILYECLTGRPPFRAATAIDTVMQVVKEDPVPPGRLVPKLPGDVETICLKCLEKDPAKRYSSAKELADDVGRFLNGESIVARPISSVERGWRWARKHPSYFVAGGFMLGSVAASIVLLASKNASLTVERNAARTAERAARAAEAEAERQRSLAVRSDEVAQTERKKAMLRLERAVTAVEQMMMRVAGEKWAHRPELQQDRREVLEEAVAFFGNLGSDESKDPIVRKQAARANVLAAMAYVSLAEYDKCRATAETARGLYAGLEAEFPKDMTFVRGEAEATALFGHIDAIQAQFSSALGHYETVLKLAERAVATEPDVAENHVALADAYQSLALFYSFQRPELSKGFHEKALAIGDRLCAGPMPGFKARLVCATALTNLAITDFGSNPAAARTKLDAAHRHVETLDRLAPPPPGPRRRTCRPRPGWPSIGGSWTFGRERRKRGSSKCGLASRSWKKCSRRNRTRSRFGFNTSSFRSFSPICC
jgi:serine/threonine-protein kinase